MLMICMNETEKAANTCTELDVFLNDSVVVLVVLVSGCLRDAVLV